MNGYYNISELSKKVMDLGASGIMIAPPSHLRTDKQIISYYQNIGEMVDDFGTRWTPVVRATDDF